jgi:hypothetical protein
LQATSEFASNDINLAAGGEGHDYFDWFRWKVSLSDGPSRKD